MLVVVAGLAASSSSSMAGDYVSYTGAGGDIDDNDLTAFFVDVPADFGVVTDLELDIRGLSHPFPDDLEIYLLHPTFATIKILQDQGDGVDLLGAFLTFRDAALNAPPDESNLVPNPMFDSRAGLITQVYRPQGLVDGSDGGFADFEGIPGGGRWGLLIVDDSMGDTGSFDGFTLRIVPEPMTMSLLALGALAALRRKRR